MPEAIDISPNHDGGVLKEIIKEGTSDLCPPLGCKVSVHYTGTLLDGTKFDSSRDRGEPFQFDLAKGVVIKAWDIGVATMKKGEQAILTCAPEYAYGEAGSPPTIPPNSTLKFDVEVIDWQGEDLSPNKDKSIERTQISPGTGYTSPNDGAYVEVHLIGTYNGKIFDERDVKFSLGEGSVENVPEGVEAALESFKKDEKSKLVLKPKYAFGETGSEKFGIPPNATVEYEVTLKEFEKSKESWSLDLTAKIELCKSFKEKGTNYFKAGNLTLAMKFYKKIINYLGSDEDADMEKEEKNNLLLSSNLNLSLCHLKQSDFYEARLAATAALEIDPKNEKGLFRRGQAYLSFAEPELAKQDFLKCLEVDPNNKAAKNQLIICQQKLKEQLQQEKKIYANMFDKFAKMDTQREEFELQKQPNVMSSVGEWGQEDREREPSEFEKENPNILLLNNTGEFKDM